MLEPLFIDVRGKTPATWGGKKTDNEKKPLPLETVKEWQWRLFLANRTKEKYRRQSSSISEQTEFTVNIVFFLKEQALKKPDLDNLAKPVLDTLFANTNSQVPKEYKPLITGVLFGVDDNRIYKLVLEKQPASTNADEGADITITWK